MNSHSAPAFPARALGSFERFFWSSDPQSAKVFAVAASIVGRTRVEEWKEALAAIQQRHPLLRAGFAVDGEGRPFFVERPGIPMALEVLDASKTTWEAEFAEQLHRPFGAQDPLLCRVTLLYAPERVTLILAAHHAIGDGMSLAYGVRDLMQAMGPQTLAAHALPASQESTFPQLPDGFEMPQFPPVEPARLLQRGTRAPTVTGVRLTAGTTQALVERARANGATVHGALVVALVLAGAETDVSWREQGVRVKSPINIRKLIGLTDECVLSILATDTCLQPHERDDFWQAARRVSSEVAAGRNLEALAGFAAMMQLFFESNPPAGAATELLLGLGVLNLLVSNLGVLPYAAEQGGLHLESLWGPSTYMGIEGEQNVGVTTINGELHMTHTSYTPLARLLEGATQWLEKAIS